MSHKDPVKAKKWRTEYDAKHAERKRENTRRWRKENPNKKRAWDLQQLGWSLELWDAVFSAQNEVCAICKKPDRHRRLAADHEHVYPPKPRGLLCSDCNTGLGKFRDNPNLLESAASYLRKYGEK